MDQTSKTSPAMNASRTPYEADAPRSLSAADRRERIRQEVLGSGSVRIDRLARDFTVSPMTIHRDLDALESDGWVRKVRGGAVTLPGALIGSTVRARTADAADAKSEIAAHAVRHLAGAQVIGLDDSTSALAFAERIEPAEPLTVVTNFLPVVTLLGRQPGFDVICLGGDYRPDYDAFFGLHTAEMARSLRTDVLFMSTTAVVDGHCLHRLQETVQVKRALMAATAKSVLLLDSAKFGRRAVQELAPLTAFDVVIVDSRVSLELVDQLRASGVSLEIADGPTRNRAST